MRICICCFGLFHRPKRRGTSYLPTKNQNFIQFAQNNSSNYILKGRRRSFLFRQEPQNKLQQIASIKGNHSPIIKFRQSQTKFIEKKSLYDLKDTFRCLFCGGTKCPCEDYKYNSKTPIKGLNCDIIDNEIYASQRPSNTLIEEYNLIKKFHEYKIGMIVNLQRPGEHPYCGPNALEPLSGYSYSPSLFTSEGIIVKLAGWKDMDVPDSLYFMLDIIKDIYKMIFFQKKKVLVHCHAGNGRTGVVIACYLIYKSNYQAEEAVSHLRKVRKKCVEKNTQMKYCIKFRQFLNTLRKIFTQDKNDVDYFIKHQCDLEIDISKKNLYIPKLFWLTFDVITELKKNYSNNQIYKALNGSLDATEQNFKEIIDMKEKIDSGEWECLIHNQSIIVVSEIFYHWLEDSVTYCINPKKILEILENKKLILSINEILLGYVSDEKIHSIYSNLKQYLKKVEMEILLYISNFYVQIYPREGIDDITEYKRMAEKIAIYILGFNIELLYNYKLQVETNSKVNNTFSHLNKTNDGDEIDANSGLSLCNCIKTVECIILILEFLKIKISFPLANECKDKIVDAVSKAKNELEKHINSLQLNVNLLKSVIVTKESDIMNINNYKKSNHHKSEMCNENSVTRKVNYNLFSDRKPFETPIKIHKSVNPKKSNNQTIKK